MAMGNPLEWLSDCSWKYPGVSAGIEWISPECAMRMLELNTHNRPLRDSTIGRAIREDDWRLNGESIVFTKSCLMGDGQHRTTEIAKSEKTVASVVVRGVSDDSQLTMDYRSVRRFRGLVDRLGYEYPTIVASITQAAYASDNGGVKLVVSGNVMKHYTQSDLTRFLSENYHERIEPIVGDVYKLHKRLKNCDTDIIGYLFDYVRNGDAADRNAFVSQIVDGTDVSNPVKQLVDKLDADAKRSTNNLTRKQIFALLVKAWNLYMCGDEDTTLTYRAGGARPEALPTPIVSSVI